METIIAREDKQDAPATSMAALQSDRQVDGGGDEAEMQAAFACKKASDSSTATSQSGTTIAPAWR